MLLMPGGIITWVESRASSLRSCSFFLLRVNMFLLGVNLNLKKQISSFLIRSYEENEAT